MQDTRIKREMSKRLEMEFTLIERAVVRRSYGLLRFRGDEHARRIGNGSVDARVEEPGSRQESDEDERFHSRQTLLAAGSVLADCAPKERSTSN